MILDWVWISMDVLIFHGGAGVTRCLPVKKVQLELILKISSRSTFPPRHPVSIWHVFSVLLIFLLPPRTIPFLSSLYNLIIIFLSLTEESFQFALTSFLSHLWVPSLSHVSEPLWPPHSPYDTTPWKQCTSHAEKVLELNILGSNPNSVTYQQG